MKNFFVNNIYKLLLLNNYYINNFFFFHTAKANLPEQKFPNNLCISEESNDTNSNLKGTKFMSLS